MATTTGLVLGLDSGFDRLGLCLFDARSSRARVAETTLNSANLTRCLKQVCPEAEGRIEAIAVAIGPGKFSSIRTGMAFALGLARADGAKVYGVSVFEMLAGAIAHPAERFLICSSGGGRIRFGQMGAVQEGSWRAAGDAFSMDLPDSPDAEECWTDPRDLGLPLPRPAARLIAEIGARRLGAEAADDSRSLRPLYVARPGLGPAPFPGGVRATGA